MECQTCSGTGWTIQQEPRKYRSHGITVTMGLQTVGISHPCDDCQGSGLGVDPAHDPDCSQCTGTGVRNAFASSGEWETEECSCVRVEVAS